jgi:hypothetical protein
VESNPHAVRLVASALDEPAYEYTNARGVRTGLLTDTFLEVLREAGGQRVSWGQLGRRVRERVLARCPQQRPEIEGPSRRLLFEVEELERDGALAYYAERNRHWLRGGRLHGVHPGDEYAVMSLGSLGSDPGQALALARVVEVLGGSSQVELQRGPGPVIPAGAPAFLLRSAQPRQAVALDGPWTEDAPLLSDLQAGLEASSFVRPVPLGEEEPVLAHVRLSSQGLDVFDLGEDRIVHPLPPHPDSVPRVVQVLELLARAHTLRELGDGEERALFEAWLDIEWGKVLHGEAMRLPTAGACLRAGERLYVRLRNQERVPLSVSVFDIGVGGCIRLLNTSQPSGLRVRPGREEWLGTHLDGRLAGLELEWPESVPAEGERPESLVFIASDRPMDLRLLETSAHRMARAPSMPLERILQGLMAGGSRAAPTAGGTSPGRYAVKHIRFWLDPRPPR